MKDFTKNIKELQSKKCTEIDIEDVTEFVDYASTKGLIVCGGAFSINPDKNTQFMYID